LGEAERDDKEIHCNVDFQVEMTVSDPVIVAVLDQVLQQVASRQVQAFEQRCQDIPIDYGLIEAAKHFRQ
jgi:ribosome-associated toxin RatA of RatAB toxin-antitoxin module